MKALQTVTARIAEGVTNPAGPGGIRQRTEERDGVRWIVLCPPEVARGEKVVEYWLPEKDPDPE